MKHISRFVFHSAPRSLGISSIQSIVLFIWIVCMVFIPFKIEMDVTMQHKHTHTHTERRKSHTEMVGKWQKISKILIKFIWLTVRQMMRLSISFETFSPLPAANYTMVAACAYFCVANIRWIYSTSRKHNNHNAIENCALPHFSVVRDSAYEKKAFMSSDGNLNIHSNELHSK